MKTSTQKRGVWLLALLLPTLLVTAGGCPSNGQSDSGRRIFVINLLPGDISALYLAAQDDNIWGENRLEAPVTPRGYVDFVLFGEGPRKLRIVCDSAVSEDLAKRVFTLHNMRVPQECTRIVYVCGPDTGGRRRAADEIAIDSETARTWWWYDVANVSGIVESQPTLSHP